MLGFARASEAVQKPSRTGSHISDLQQDRNLFLPLHAGTWAIMMGTAAIASLAGMLLGGSLYAALRKVLFQLTGPGLNGQVHTFEKPWFTSAEGAMACALCIIPFFWLRRRSLEKEKQTKGEEPAMQPLLSGTQHRDLDHELGIATEGALTRLLDLGGKDPEQEVVEQLSVHYEHGRYGWRWRKVKRLLKVVAPATAAMLSVGLQGAGLAHLPASVSQMLTGSVIIFAAILSRLILKRRLNRWHYAGLFANMLGLTAVACSNLFMGGPAAAGGSQPVPQADPSEVLMGVALTILSQFIGATQLVLEELLMTDVQMHPFELLSWEGVFGTTFMVFALLVLNVMPGSDVGGKMENLADTFAMLRQSRTVLGIDLVVVLCVLAANIGGVYVTVYLGSVFRAVLTVTLSGLIWALDVALFYSPLGHRVFGEPLDPQATPIQMLGFLLGIIGTVVYANGSSRVVQAQEALAEAHAEPETPSGMAIIRQVYYPASVQIPAVRQVASYLELNNALEEVKATSFVDTLTARTSWILKPAEVEPTAAEGLTPGAPFQDPFVPPLPIEVLPNGALQYGDPEDGGYCVPPGGGFQAPAADDHGDDK